MHIVIDGRLYWQTGVGRYIRNLIKFLPEIDNQNFYSLLLLPEDFKKIELPSPKWKKISVSARWHTIKEQIALPLIINKINPDLVHFPYFNAPLLCNNKFVVTIHDLTILNYATGKASTHSLIYYYLKRLGFWFSINKAVYKSVKIITVSQTVKKELLAKFSLPENKITVTYESGEVENIKEKKINQRNQITDLFIGKLLLPENYLLSVGNAHPHKNIGFLIKSFIRINEIFPDLYLVLVGNDDFFYQRLKKETSALAINNRIIFTGGVSDAILESIYQKAKALIFPSLSEGFGLPGLEAMNAGIPIVCSNLPIFREIYQDACLYFDHNDLQDLTNKIINLLNNSDLSNNLIAKGFSRVKQFSWKKMAEETLKVYESCVGI